MSVGAESFERITVRSFGGADGSARFVREAVHKDLINGVTFAVPVRVCRREDEGITWVRGWHEPESEVLAAMLVADALGESRRVDSRTPWVIDDAKDLASPIRTRVIAPPRFRPRFPPGGRR